MAVTSVDLTVPAYLRIFPTAKGQYGAKEKLGAPKDGLFFLEESTHHARMETGTLQPCREISGEG